VVKGRASNLFRSFSYEGREGTLIVRGLLKVRWRNGHPVEGEILWIDRPWRIGKGNKETPFIGGIERKNVWAPSLEINTLRGWREGAGQKTCLSSKEKRASYLPRPRGGRKFTVCQFQTGLKDTRGRKNQESGKRWQLKNRGSEKFIGEEMWTRDRGALNQGKGEGIQNRVALESPKAD